MSSSTTTSLPSSATSTTTGPTSHCTAPSVTGSTSPGQFNISSQFDADAFNDCTDLYGDFVILGDNITALELSGVQTLNGDLTATACSNLINISAPAMQVLNGNSELARLPLLATLHFPSLGWIHGGLTWNSLPVIKTLDFNSSELHVSGVNGDLDIVITDTSLSDLSFLVFPAGSSKIHNVEIFTNPQLSLLSFTGITDVTGGLIVAQNGANTQLLLPDLLSIGSAMLSDVMDLQVPALGFAEAELIINNSTFTRLALPNLSGTYSDIIIQDNPLLQELVFPKMSAYGNVSIADFKFPSTLVIANNSALRNVKFPIMEYAANVEMIGNFSIILMPQLKSISQNFHISSTVSSFDCSFFDQLNHNITSHTGWSTSFDAVGYSYSCSATLPGSTKDVAKHWTTGSHLGKRAEDGIIAVAVIVGLAIIACSVWVLQRWRRGSLLRRRDDSEDAHDIHLVDVKGPPPYDRAGHGETPPGYDDNNVSRETLEEGMPTAGVSSYDVTRMPEGHHSTTGQER